MMHFCPYTALISLFPRPFLLPHSPSFSPTPDPTRSASSGTFSASSSTFSAHIARTSRPPRRGACPSGHLGPPGPPAPSAELLLFPGHGVSLPVPPNNTHTTSRPLSASGPYYHFHTWLPPPTLLRPPDLAATTRPPANLPPRHTTL